MLRKEQITEKVLQILKEHPEGLKYSELVKFGKEQFPNFPSGTIHGSIWNLDTKLPNKIYKPSRGLFKLTIYKSEEELTDGAETEVPKPDIHSKIKEEDFYQPFADWIVNELEECTSAISLGRNYFKDKWGTPDVIGIRESRRSDIIKTNTEIISAEIKIDTNGLIIAFGQVCSYKLFSHRTYIVVPRDSSEDDIGRLDALSRIFGIGLILFDNSSPDNPIFEIRTRASRHEPDMFYVNKYIKLIEDKLFE